MVQSDRLLKLPIFVVELVAASKNEVEIYQKSISAVFREAQV